MYNVNEFTGEELAQAYEDGYEQGRKTAMRWISVKDRLPEKSGEYLAITKSRGHYMVLPYSAKHKLFNSYDSSRGRELKSAIECTHWMPLPEPPEGE